MIIDTIVTDMDDTMLNGESKISERTFRVVEECKRRGIRVIAASGRTAASMYPYMAQLHTGMPYIGGNGSEIIGADHQMIEQLTLDVELAREVIAALLDVGFHVHAYRDDSFYYGVECEAAENYKKSSKMKGVAVGDLCRFLDFPTPKLLAVGPEERVAQMYPIMTERFADRVSFTVSKPYFLEAEPLNASKGNALRRLAEMRGDITPEHTLCFGDSKNDISLLSYTPNSVAMANGREELKQIAAYVCPPNTEDGWARFIEEHVLHTTV